MTTGLNPQKLQLARWLARSGVSAACLQALRRRHHGAYIRAVNYHGTPEDCRAGLAAHLEFYQRHFVPAGRAELETILAGRTWPHPRPGLLITFDDGLRNNLTVAAPLLEQAGFPAWLMIPAGFIEAPPERQREFAAAHRVWPAPAAEGPRVAMSWDELRAAQTRHIIGCHTQTHHRLTAATPADQLDLEIRGARQQLEAHLQAPVDVFCWVGGEEQSYSAPAAALIRAAGYRWSFMTNTAPITAFTHPLQLQRSNIEANWPVEIVLFQICGLMDLLYTRKRARVNRLTAA